MWMLRTLREVLLVYMTICVSEDCSQRRQVEEGRLGLYITFSSLRKHGLRVIVEGADASAVRRPVSSVQSHVYSDTLMSSPTVSISKYKDIGGRPRRSHKKAKRKPHIITASPCCGQHRFLPN